MPQLQLPMFPVGVTHITSLLAFIKEEGNITYFKGSLPVFSHTEEDTPSFRVRRQLPCPVGDNYLDRLTDM